MTTPGQLLQALQHHIRGRLSLRAMLSVLMIAGVVSILVLAISYFALRERERAQLYAGLDELASAVEGSASAAAFALDSTLAAQVAHGLLANPAVARVSIRSGNALPVDLQRPGLPASAAFGEVRSHELPSPFDADETIGRLEILPLESHVEQTAGAAARLLAALLALELLIAAAAVGWVVFTRITAPIAFLAQHVSRVQLETASLIWPPAGNEDDEIGQLTRDLNLMIVRNRGLLLDERALREDIEASERKFRLIFENAETGIFTLDAQLRLLLWNPALHRTFGAEALALAGHPPSLAALLACPPEALLMLSKQTDQEGGAASADFEIAGQTGRHVHIVLTRTNTQTLLGVCNDISERKHAEARAQALAERDPLTGLFNRRGFNYRASHALAQVNRAQGVAVLMLDLDGFKALNDALGHEAGDDALRCVARLLEGCVRKNDLLARLGGDEFVVLLDGLREPQPAQQVAEKILQAIATLQGADVHGVRLGASIGVAMSFDPGERIDALMRRADQAMYAVKRSGKHNWRFANGQ